MADKKVQVSLFEYRFEEAERMADYARSVRHTFDYDEDYCSAQAVIDRCVQYCFYQLLDSQLGTDLARCFGKNICEVICGIPMTEYHNAIRGKGGDDE